MGGTTYTTNASGNWNWTAHNWTNTSTYPNPSSLANNDVVQIGTASSTCNVTYTGGMTFGNSISIIVYAGSSLTINGNVTASNSFDVTVQKGATLVIYGDLDFSGVAGGTDVIINGEVDVTGSLKGPSSNAGSYTGTGSVIAGTVNDPNSKFPVSWFRNTNERYAIANGSWSLDNGTWSNVPNGVVVSSPSNNSNVHIETYTVTNTSYSIDMDGSSETVHTLIVGAGNTLNIKPGKTLKVDSIVTINGTLNIQSDASGTGVLLAANYNITGTGTINVQRNCAGTQFHFISSPFNNTNVNMFSASNGNFYYYDEAAFPNDGDWQKGWLRPTAGSTMTVGRGYGLYYYPTVWTFSGTPSQLNQGALQYQLQYSGAVDLTNTKLSSKSWNLVGNPYMTSLDANTFINVNVAAGLISGTLYFWDVGSATYSSNDYASYNKTGGTASTSTSGLPSTIGSYIPDGTIEVGQGFIVSSKKADFLQFTPSMQKTKASPHFFKSSKQTGGIDRVSIDLRDASGNGNNILVGMCDSVGLNYTEGYDGLKRKGNPKIAFYSMKDQIECAISCFPPSTTEFEVPIAFDTQVGGSMSIKFASLQNNSYSGLYYLLDKQQNTSTRCYSGTTYDFTAAVGTTANRFALKYVPPTLSVSEHELSFTANEGSSASFSISSNTNWHIEAPDWLDLSYYGGSENQSVTVTAHENLSVYPRNFALKVIVNGMEPEVINITQEKGEPFMHLPSGLQAKSTPDTLAFPIHCNSPWRITQLPAWAQVSQTSGDAFETVLVYVAGNPSIKTRETQIAVEANSLSTQTLQLSQDAAAPLLQSSVQSLSFASSVDLSVLGLTSTVSWSITGIPDWLSLSKTSGDGNETLSLTTTENLGLNSRSATLSLSSAEAGTLTVDVVQLGRAPFLQLAASEINLTGNAQALNLSFTANTSLTIESDQAWAAVGLRVAASVNETLTLDISKNPLATPRTATISFSGDGISAQSLKLVQAGLPYLETSTNQLSAAASSSSNSFSISSNTTWSITSTENWLTLSKTSGEGNETITLDVAENTKTTTRTATLEVKRNDGTASSLISISQAAAAPRLQLTSHESIVGAEAQSVSLSYSSNSTVTVSCAQNWVALKTSADENGGTVEVSISQNTGADTRIASISFRTEGLAEQLFSLSQTGFTPANLIEQQSKLKAYPNPSSGNLRLEYKDAYIGVVQLIVRDMAGRELQRKQVQKDTETMEQDLSLSAWADGIYMLEIKGEKSYFISISLKR